MRADPLGPEPGAVDQNVAGDGAAVGDDAAHAALVDDDLLDADALLDPGAIHAARALA